MAGEVHPTAAVLQSKRASTRFQVLAEIADNQPAISQREIAEAIGVSNQAVSEYLRDLVDDGYVHQHGRGRYEVTNEGVDWMLSEIETLEAYLTHVAEEVLGTVDHETAIATAPIAEGDAVGLAMVDGTLRATPDDGDGSATAVAVTAAEAGQDVGVAGWEGIIEYDLGRVAILRVPTVREGGSRAIATGDLRDHVEGVDIVAAAGTEAVAALGGLEREPDIRFGTPAAVQEAAARGLDVLLVCTSPHVGEHTERLGDLDIGYDLVDGA